MLASAAAHNEPSLAPATTSCPMVQNGAPTAPEPPNSSLTPSPAATYPDGAAPAPLHHCTAAAPAPDSAAPAEPSAPPDGPDVMHLSPIQQQALDLYFQGHSACAIAEELGIHRNTFHRWKHHHPAFIAALNKVRSDRAEDLNGRLSALLDQAITCVEKHLSIMKTNPAAVATSLKVIGGLSRNRSLFSSGPTNAFTILDAMIHNQRHLGGDKPAPITDHDRAYWIGQFTQILTNERDDALLPTPSTTPPAARSSDAP